MKSINLTLAALAFTIFPNWAQAGGYDGPSMIQTYEPIAPMLKTETCNRISPPVFHRRPCPPKPGPSEPCPNAICPKPSVSAVQVGSIVTVTTNYLGKEQGHVLMKIGLVTHECPVIEWCPTYVKFHIPNMGLRESVPTTFEFVRPDGIVVRCDQVCLVSKPSWHVQPIFEPKPGDGAKHTHIGQTHGLLLNTPSTTE